MAAGPALEEGVGVEHPPSHQVVGKILNPSSQNMDLDRKEK